MAHQDSKDLAFLSLAEQQQEQLIQNGQRHFAVSKATPPFTLIFCVNGYRTNPGGRGWFPSWGGSAGLPPGSARSPREQEHPWHRAELGWHPERGAAPSSGRAEAGQAPSGCEGRDSHGQSRKVQLSCGHCTLHVEMWIRAIPSSVTEAADELTQLPQHFHCLKELTVVSEGTSKQNPHLGNTEAEKCLTHSVLGDQATHWGCEEVEWIIEFQQINYDEIRVNF